MAEVIAVVNQKGGVGKTTTSVNLGSALAMQGRRVLLLDLDPQTNATSGLGVNHQDFPHSVYNLLVDDIDAYKAIAKTSEENYWVFPSSPDLSGASVELVNQEKREFRLKEKLESLQDKFDYIIIDCPPSLGLLTVNGLVGSSKVLIPVQAEYYALEGLGQLLNTVGLVQEHIAPDLEIMGAVVTMFDRRNKIAGQVVDELKKYFPYKVFDSVIPRNVRLTEAPSHGQTIFQYSPNCSGAIAYQRLGREVIDLENL